MSNDDQQYTLQHMPREVIETIASFCTPRTAARLSRACWHTYEGVKALSGRPRTPPALLDELATVAYSDAVHAPWLAKHPEVAVHHARCWYDSDGRPDSTILNPAVPIHQLDLINPPASTLCAYGLQNVVELRLTTIWAHGHGHTETQDVMAVLRTLPHLRELDLRCDVNEWELPAMPGLLRLGITCNTAPTVDFLKFTSLQALKVEDCTRGGDFEHLPPMLVDLRIIACDGFFNIPRLPETLRLLDITKHMHLQDIPRLPESLQHLELRDCHALTHLPDLPTGLRLLVLMRCQSVTSMPAFPERLRRISLVDVAQLATLPPLPTHLRFLKAKHINVLQELPQMPPQLVHACVVKCLRIQRLPPLPPTLVELTLRGCKALLSLPCLPSGLRSIDVSGCDALVEIPTLPRGLICFKANRCAALESVPAFPTTITEIDVRIGGSVW